MFNKRCLILAALLFLGNASDLVGGEVIQQQISVSSVLSDIATSLHHLVRLQATQMQPSTLTKITTVCSALAAIISAGYIANKAVQGIKNAFKKESPISPALQNLDPYVGNEQAINKILKTTQNVKKSIENPQPINGLGKPIYNTNFLLLGEPGTGKSHLAKTILAEAENLKIKTKFCNIGDLLSKFVGETPNKIQEMFNEANGQPLVIAFDEAAILFKNRQSPENGNKAYYESITSTLLNCIGSHPNVIVIASVNSINDIDEAMIRAGRLDIINILKPQTKQERLDILKQIFKKRQITIDDESALARTAEMTENFTQSDLASLTTETRAACEELSYTQFIGEILIQQTTEMIAKKQRLKECSQTADNRTADNRKQHIDPQIMNLLLNKMFPSSVGNPVAHSAAKPITRSTSSPGKLDSLTKKRSTAPAEGGASKHD